MTLLSKITVDSSKCMLLKRNRSLSTHDRQNMKRLVMRMKSETTSTGGVYAQKLNFVNKLDNGRMKFFSVPPTDNAFITFEKVENLTIDIDKKTGKITNYKKPFFMSWKKIMKQISENLDDLMSNYHNEQKVEKGSMGMFVMTEKGEQKIQEAQMRTFGCIL